MGRPSLVKSTEFYYPDRDGLKSKRRSGRETWYMRSFFGGTDVGEATDLGAEPETQKLVVILLHDGDGAGLPG